MDSTISASSSGRNVFLGCSGLGTMAPRATWRMVSPASEEGSGAASFLGPPINALSPLPKAAGFAIPDFVKSLRGGKLIRRGIGHRA